MSSPFQPGKHTYIHKLNQKRNKSSQILCDHVIGMELRTATVIIACYGIIACVYTVHYSVHGIHLGFSSISFLFIVDNKESETKMVRDLTLQKSVKMLWSPTSQSIQSWCDFQSLYYSSHNFFSLTAFAFRCSQKVNKRTSTYVYSVLNHVRGLFLFICLKKNGK